MTGTWSQPAACVPDCSEGVQYTSSETAFNIKLKMDHEKWRHETVIDKINTKSKLAEEACSRNVQQAKDEHFRTLAYGRVYQIHSFDKYDPFKDDPIEGKARRRKRKKKPKRPDTFLTLPHLQKEKDEPETLVNSSECQEHHTLTFAALNKSFPKIADIASNEKETDSKSLCNSNYNALCLWKTAAQKLFVKPTKKVRSKDDISSKKVAVSLERPQRKTIFPGECKTQAALKRFMEQEAEQLMQEMLAPKHKKEDSIRKMVEKAQLPNLIRRDKTFSAIVRDFKVYKEEKEERKHKKMIDYISRHYNHIQ